MSYSKHEISKIIAKASEIQNSKEMDNEMEGLSETELIEIAEEIGISKSAVIEAIQNLHDPDLTDQRYDFLRGTSKIQHVTTVGGHFTEEQWEELVLEIRKITGGIGKISKVGKTYEWEQRKTDFGYKHFSLTPANGKTKIQMVSSWGPFKMITGFLSFFFFFLATLLIVKGISYKEIALMIAPFAGLAGFGLSRFFLKSYFEKQKKSLAKLSSSLSRKILSFKKESPSSIDIESKDTYGEDSETGRSDTSTSTKV